MDGKLHGKASFVEQMGTMLLQYELEKIKRQVNFHMHGDHHKRQREAKEALIELNNDVDLSLASEEDIFIGRWSHYRVPDKPQDRLSLNNKIHKKDQQKPFLKHPLDKTEFTHNCRSQKTIPKLKVILHQLQQPLNLPPRKASNSASVESPSHKGKQQSGKQTLTISNKQEIRPSIKSERKSLTIDSPLMNGIENRRPLSNYDNLTIKTSAGSYQKIKRHFGFNNKGEKDLQYDKQLLSQLMKDRGRSSTINNMIDYFAQPATKKKSTAAKLGLDNLLS